MFDEKIRCTSVNFVSKIIANQFDMCHNSNVKITLKVV